MDLEAVLLDLYLYRLRRVGRKHMTYEQLHAEWLERS